MRENILSKTYDWQSAVTHHVVGLHTKQRVKPHAGQRLELQNSASLSFHRDSDPMEDCSVQNATLDAAPWNLSVILADMLSTALMIGY